METACAVESGSESDEGVGMKDSNKTREGQGIRSFGKSLVPP